MITKLPGGHVLYRLLVGAMAFACTSCADCFSDGTNVYFRNQGLDPIHVGGERIGMQETKFLGNLERLEFQDLSLTRMDINLGSIYIAEQGTREKGLYKATITMRETTYFHFVFESDDPNVSVVYRQP
jgi:hypothetical protein